MRLIFFCLLISIFHLEAQEKHLSLDVKNIKLIKVLNQLEDNFEVHFSYSDKNISKEKITLKFRNKTLNEIIVLLNQESDLDFERLSERNIIIQKIHFNNNSNLIKTHLLKEVVLNENIQNGIYKKPDGSYHLSPKEIDVIPGQTEPDILQSIQTIPGVVSSDETASNIYVRGGAPDQNLILWNGIKIYQTGHLFGSFSAFNPYITKKIAFINKGTDAKYGDRISSVIDIKTNEKISKEFKGGFGFNLIDFDGYIEVPIIKDKLSVEISGRRSITDFFPTETYKKYSEKVFQNQNSEEIFKGKDVFFYTDYSLKFNGKIGNNNLLSLSLININNDLRSELSNEEDLTFNDELKTSNFGLNFIWKRKLSPQWRFYAESSYSNYSLSFIHNEKYEEDNEKTHPTVNNSNEVTDSGVNIDFENNLSDKNILHFGYQVSNYHIEYALEDSKKNYQFLTDQSSLTSHSLYTSYLYKNKKLFDITGGIRFTYFTTINNFKVEPRINLTKNLNPYLSVQLTAENKTQAISQIDQTINQNLTLEDKVWSLANNDKIPLTTSWQYTAGLSFAQKDWFFQLDTYYKEINGLTTLNNGFIDYENFKIEKGESSIIGSDFYLKKQFNNLISSLSYTLSSSVNNFEDVNESQRFPTNTDIRHNLYWSNIFSYKDFKFTIGWRWHSGKPYSKAISIEENENGVKYLKYDGINNYRLPAYSRLDITGTYDFDIVKQKNIKGKIGISLLNIFDSKNILSRSYQIDHTNEQINSFDQRSIQRVANFVLRVYW